MDFAAFCRYERRKMEKQQRVTERENSLTNTKAMDDKDGTWEVVCSYKKPAYAPKK